MPVDSTRLPVSVMVGWLWTGAVMYLPETDSTPQIHPRSGLLPPNTWIKGWRWYLEPPGITEMLLSEWAQTPPDFVVVFPLFAEGSQPAIDPLLQFTEANYREVTRFEQIPLHGTAIIYERISQPDL